MSTSLGLVVKDQFDAKTLARDPGCDGIRLDSGGFKVGGEFKLLGEGWVGDDD